MEEWLKENYKKCLIVILCIIILLGIILFLLRKPVYEVTFDSNGGSEVSSVKVKKGDKVEKPEDPTKDGYIFGRWEYEDKEYDFNRPVTKDMTLKAIWGDENKGISLDNSTLTLKPEEETNLKVNISGDGIKLEDLVFTSSDDSIVKVDNDGKLTALKEGKVTITIKTKDGKYSTTCEIVVASEVIEVESVAVSGNNKVTVGSIIKLTATVKPNNATNNKVTWKSSNTKVAIVDQNGNVKGVSAGTVIITITSDNGKNANIKITVEAKPEEVKPQPDTPSNPTNPEPDTPTNPEPSTPGGSTGGSQGGGTTTPDVPVTGVTIKEGASLTLQEGASKKLTAVIEPTNATNKNVTWSSNNGSFVSVDADGTIHALKPGSAVITATTANGKSASITVTVTAKPDVYNVNFKPQKNELGEIMSYVMTITKNGSPLPADEFESVIYGGEEKLWGLNGVVLKKLIPGDVPKGPMQIIVKDASGAQKTVSATVTVG